MCGAHTLFLLSFSFPLASFPFSYPFLPFLPYYYCLLSVRHSFFLTLPDIARWVMHVLSAVSDDIFHSFLLLFSDTRCSFFLSPLQLLLLLLLLRLLADEVALSLSAKLISSFPREYDMSVCVVEFSTVNVCSLVGKMSCSICSIDSGSPGSMGVLLPWFPFLSSVHQLILLPALLKSILLVPLEPLNPSLSAPLLLLSNR